MLILGSSSPARLDILTKFQIKPNLIISPEVDETPLKKETPKNLSIRLAKLKGNTIGVNYPKAAIISADTVVCVGRRIIDKCYTEQDVINAMKMLSGCSHKVFTTVCVTFEGKQRIKTVETKIKFKRLTDFEIEEFAKTKEGIGKSGGYTIGGLAERFILNISGSVSSVLGLPSYQLFCLLKSIKY